MRQENYSPRDDQIGHMNEIGPKQKPISQRDEIFPMAKWKVCSRPICDCMCMCAARLDTIHAAGVIHGRNSKFYVCYAFPRKGILEPHVASISLISCHSPFCPASALRLAITCSAPLSSLLAQRPSPPPPFPVAPQRISPPPFPPKFPGPPAVSNGYHPFGEAPAKLCLIDRLFRAVQLIRQ